ncbi:hypothetical protein [Wenxinia saemankumensis]|uniref:Uncharacterized protein n=1 Tax=Wenxinia saemankumensis TaxID=1447782 RepID=A0A1M6HXU1_9RHOB|nr:hypothetical protein [Wenxinia saemankumensis]SHJ27025.1 hypothetical protein SAMN05444417_3409 [Wenxinia saemankumensis]
MTEDAFRAALAARGLSPTDRDRAAALEIARYLARCARLLREAEAGDA